jgi:DNA polymerase
MHVEMTQEQAAEAVAFYRKEYPEVPACWKAMERAAIAAIQNHATQRVGPVVFQGLKDLLRILLPSGRSLYYIRPQVRWEERESWSGDTYTRACISYEGVDSETKQWVRLDTFGGGFFENVVQAIARDVLALGMLRAAAAGFVIVGHVHDEIITLTPDDSKLTLDDLRLAMIQKVEWMPSLLLDAAGFSGVEYKKE